MSEVFSIGRVRRIHPETDEADWRRHENAWIHKDATVLPTASILGGILRSGTFERCVIHGGRFENCVVHDGTFHSGMIAAGEYFGGEFHQVMVYSGATIRVHGGLFHGTTLEDGVVRNGFFGHEVVIRGGEFLRGVYHAGQYWGGVFRDSPPLLTEFLRWPITIGAPGMISIGCNCLTLDEWRNVATLSPDAIQTRFDIHYDDVAHIIREYGPVLFALAESWLKNGFGPTGETEHDSRYLKRKNHVQDGVPTGGGTETKKGEGGA